MESNRSITSLGMTEKELTTYLEELLRDEAERVIAQERNRKKKLTVEEQLASPGFVAVRAAALHTIRLISANNAFLARHLLDLGVLQPSALGADEEIEIPDDSIEAERLEDV